jgi:hypothetical protein
MGGDTQENAKLRKELMDLSKDAARLRGIKVNIQVGQTGGLFGLFKKKYDVYAAEIVKKIDNKDTKYTTDGTYNAEKTKKIIAAYYGYDANKTGLTGSALKKHTEAKNNYIRALHKVEMMVEEPVKKASTKSKSYSKLTDEEKKEKQKIYDERRGRALMSRELKISKGKSEDTLKTVLRKGSKGESLVKKGALGKADLIIRHAADTTDYLPDVPCIVYDDKTIKILDMLLTAQFHEPTRLRKLFYEGKGSKKASLLSEVKRRISRMGNIDLTKTRKARSRSQSRMLSKVKKGEIVKASKRNDRKFKPSYASKSVKVPAAVNTDNEAALQTKKAELKKLGFALFGKSKKRKQELQGEIKTLENKIKPNTPVA